MSYKILAGSDEEFEVIEYPTHADERRFNRLLTKTTDALVSRQTKERVCDKWGWYEEVEVEDEDKEEETVRVYEDYITDEVTDQGEYHLRLAKIIFEDAEGLSEDDIDHLRGGLIQEARVDFIEGCEGRSEERVKRSSAEALTQVLSRLGLNGQTTETETSPSTVGS